MLEWVKRGNSYAYFNAPHRASYPNDPPPNHPRLSADDGLDFCVYAKSRTATSAFPKGIVTSDGEIGTDGRQILPGLYEYRGRTGDNRLPGAVSQCFLRLKGSDVDLPYGKLFTVRLFEYHETVSFYFCGGFPLPHWRLRSLQTGCGLEGNMDGNHHGSEPVETRLVIDGQLNVQQYQDGAFVIDFSITSLPSIPFRTGRSVRGGDNGIPCAARVVPSFGN